MMNKLIEIAEWHGKLQQSQILMEECAELICAVSKMARGGMTESEYVKAYLNLFEEIADVEIMIAQIEHLYKVDRELVEQVKKEKIERELKRMEADGYVEGE